MAKGDVQLIDGEGLVTMIMEGVEDADDEALRKMTEVMLGRTVRRIRDDQFEIDW